MRTFHEVSQEIRARLAQEEADRFARENDPAPLLIPLVDAVDDTHAGELLDANRLECSECASRPAYAIVGVYADHAVCEHCAGYTSFAEASRNHGEFPNA